MISNSRRWLTLVVCVVSSIGSTPKTFAADPQPAKVLTLVVMDPLALPLSCPCVKGYAQRNYEKLAEHLSAELKRPVKIAFHESLIVAMDKETGGRADIVIGKHSVVLADAKRAKHPLDPMLALTGKDGQTMMSGWFVVPATDPAVKVADLNGYRIIFGPAECDEKHAAAIKLLQVNKVSVPAELETCAACSDGASTILELGRDVRAATVISSYAAPLLEGCGTIKKGDLRMIGTTAPVPFVEAFVSQTLSDEDRAAIESALLSVASKPELLAALETKQGFIPIAAQKKS